MQASTVEKLLVALLARLGSPELKRSATRTPPRRIIDAGDILGSKDASIGAAVELGRLIRMCREALTISGQSAFLVAQEVKAFIDAMHAILAVYRLNSSALSDEESRVMAELLEQTAGAYQWSYYQRGFSGQVAELHTQHALALLDLIQRYAHQMPSPQPRLRDRTHPLAARS